MAKTNNAINARERVNTEVVCCMDCLHSNLHRYGSNPVLAQCTMRPNPGNVRFPYRVEVASARWICPLYSHHEGEKLILQKVRTAA